MFAALKVLFHPGAQFRTGVALEIIQDLTPDLFATDFDYHGLTCLSSLRPALQLPSIPGARPSRLSRRARMMRVFTALFLIPTSPALSSLLQSVRSRTTNASH